MKPEGGRTLAKAQPAVVPRSMLLRGAEGQEGVRDGVH